MIGIVQIPQENIETVWNLVDDSITKALAYSGHHYNTSDVYAGCVDGSCQLWLGWDETAKQKLKAYYGNINSFFVYCYVAVVNHLSS